MALMEMQIRLQHQQAEAKAQSQREQFARQRAQFEENCRLYDAMNPNIIDLGPDSVREIKDVPLLPSLTKDL